MGALLYMVLVAAALSTMTTQSVVGQRDTRQARDYSLANQMANMALSDALYQMNQAELPPDNYPTIASKDNQCGAVAMSTAIRTLSEGWEPGNIGCGEQSHDADGTISQQNLSMSAKWQWYVEPVNAGVVGANVSKRYILHAVGGYNNAIRTITADLHSMKIRSAFNNVDTGSISYDTAPSSVFNHAIFANSEVRLNNSVITGSIGSSDKITDTAATSSYTSTSTPPKSTPTFLYDYGNVGKGTSDVRCKLGTDAEMATAAARTRANSPTTVCRDKVLVASLLYMNRSVVDNAADTCTLADETRDWTASDYASPRFYADGSMACYRNVTFDKATQIVGNSTFGIVVNGKVSISAPITSGEGSLILYHSLTDNPGSVGNIDFVDTTPAIPTKLDLFIYSPNGACNFTGAEIRGGIACNSVSLTQSKASWKGLPEDVNQPGFSSGDDTLFNRTLWYLGNYDEKAAVNPNA